MAKVMSNEWVKGLACCVSSAALFTASLALALVGCPAVCEADVLVPETTPTANMATTYAKGEGSYAVVSEAREARLYVGGDNGEALAVVDASAIRGEIHTALKPDALLFDRSDHVVKTSEDSVVWHTDKDSLEAGKEWFRIVAKDGGPIDYISFGDSASNLKNPEIAATIDTRTAPDGNGIKFIIHHLNCTGGDLSITNIVAYRIDDTTRGNKTDAVLNKYYIKDTVGTMDLGNLRMQYNRKIDQVAGYRWSQWHASNTVFLASHALVLDPAKHYYLKSEDDVFGIYAGGKMALQMSTGGDGSRYANATAVSFTGIDVGDEKVLLTFEITHTGTLDESALAILRSRDLGKTDGTFFGVPYTVVSRTKTATGTLYAVEVAKGVTETSKDKAGFFKVAYGSLSSVVKVEFNAPVQFNSGLILKGTDGKLYNITVTGGTVKAIAVN